jgi:hypothetical protein
MALNISSDASYITCRSGNEYERKQGEVNNMKAYITNDETSH